MQQRPVFVQTDKQRLSGDAAKLRNEALDTPPGVERERLIQRAQNAEIASLNSRGMQSPK